MSPKLNEISLDQDNFILWAPEPGQTINVGPEQIPFVLPRIPLPVHPTALEDGPSTNAIGQGVYDYLRKFPDCPCNIDYAELLRDAYPHFLSDLGSQILMLDHKEVDSYYIRRKITYMKILALLDGDNPGLQQRLGIEYYNLSQMFTEFGECRQHLLKAMAYFYRVFKMQPGNLTALNYLAQIDYLFGDYPAAINRWRQVIDGLDDGPPRHALTEKVAMMTAEGVPEYPLIDDFEQIWAAMECYGRGEIAEAATTLNIIEERGKFSAAFPCPEFYYLLGMCRSKNDDQGGAFEALEKALELNPDYSLAQEAKNRFLEDGKV
ncbi:MAG: hypothetical protein A2X84_09435 [Desulfuromonadaceae bacterium GWC2_58_13]|nr:MAG: hypothetical protein A2X84_09435 [Desulfuromonadaceae bacterium GWC2_58_13]